MVIHIKGKDLALIEQQAGLQRLQRVPPTERSGRVHSSSVTVTVLDATAKNTNSGSKFLKRKAEDFKVDWFNGTTKAGGQHHQKNATCCRLTHLPTGIVKTSQTRSRKNSEMCAMSALVQELDILSHQENHHHQNNQRQVSTGSGERGALERQRTWRFQDNMVLDHQRNLRAPLSKVLAGNFKLLSQ